MPLQNVTYNTPFVADDLVELLDIMNELHDEMPILSGAWTDQNQVFLGASGVDTYHLMTNFPVNSVEDLKGRKILAPGPSATWLEGTGAVARRRRDAQASGQSGHVDDGSENGPARAASQRADTEDQEVVAAGAIR